MSFKDGMKPITSDEIKNLRYAVQYFQDCYLVSSVSSLTKTSNGRRILTENIAHTDDGYRIRFQNVKGKCQDYFVSQKEIDLLTYLDKYGNTIIIPEDKPHNQIIKAIETAMNKLLRRYPDKKSFLCRIPNCNEKFEFNKPSVFLEMFTGKKPIKLNEDGLSLNLKSKKTECIDLFEKISKEPENSFVAGTSFNFNRKFSDYHCYSVQNIDREKETIELFDHRLLDSIVLTYNEAIKYIKYFAGYFNKDLL